LTAAAIAADIGIFTNKDIDTFEKIQMKVKLGEATAVVKSSENSDEKSSCRSLLLNGAELNNITHEEWRCITKYDEIVFARITPEQKLLIVNELQNDGLVVGVTGDGVNDAPALKKADIGIAMGSGSEVAMEASQLVLLDSNFSSMLIAIENGRLVFENLRKVILYLLPAGCIGMLYFLNFFFAHIELARRELSPFFYQTSL
jgi:sodium/potassium-transporting ATPase subunit alpha